MADLNQETIEYLLQQGGREVSYPEGETVVHRGQSGEAFYVVTGGAVDVILVADDGRRLPLARLSAGASFGEMSLLTGEPISADVVAASDVTLLVYPGERFQTALGECAPLRNHILARLCEDLRQTNTKAWGFFQRAEAFRTLMHEKGRIGPIVAESRAMRLVQEQIVDLAPKSGPVLITGEPGTGKLFVATEIHDGAAGEHAPQVVVDCLVLGDVEAGQLLFGTSDGRRFDQQAPDGGALQRLGALDLADRGTIVLQHVDALDTASQDVLSGYLKALSDDGESVSPRVRVIATTREDIDSLVEAGRFNAALARQLSAATVEMPSLLERKRDILPLANVFLQARDKHSQDIEHWFNTSAEHAIVSAHYRYRNVAELRESVEFAALFADGDEIGSEHIFTGPKDEGATAEYDLGQSAAVGWLLDSGGLRVLQVGVFAIFAAITAVCIVSSGTVATRIANGLVWAIWWPILMILFLFVGRAWCTVCAISLVGRMARRVWRFGLPLKKPPQWVKKHAAGLSLLLFLAIVWSEHMFDMTHRPFATGILLLTLMGAAVGFCLLYQREVWCRYLCPLGSLGAGLSGAATMHVRANPSVCATQCRTHECFKGAELVPGCPVFHHPMYARDGQFCKLCLRCLRTCPHGSPKLYFRPPLQGIWRITDVSHTLVPFALGVFFLALVMLASHGSAWVSAAGPYTALTVLAVGMGLTLHRGLRRLLGRGDADPAMVPPIAFALLVLGSGPLMAFHLGNVPTLGEVHIQAAAGSFLSSYLAAGSVDLLVVLQIAVILLAAFFAAIILSRIHARFARQGANPAPWGWRVLLGLCGGYLLTALCFTGLGGAHP